MRHLATLGALLGLAAATPAAEAAILVQQGYGGAVVTNAYCASCFGTGRVFDSFTLASDAVLDGLSLTIQQSYGANWSIDLAFWMPDYTTLVATVNLAPGSYTVTPGADPDTAVIDAVFAPLALSAGSYAISFFEPTNMGVTAFADPGELLRQDGYLPSPGTFMDMPDVTARFTLTGTPVVAVTEPRSLALIGTGLVGIGLLARRRRLAAQAEESGSAAAVGRGVPVLRTAAIEPRIDPRIAAAAA